MRIGLYGGTFDPIHHGHLLVARAAFEEMGLDRLCFIPAAHSPFKPGMKPLAGAWRARMVRLALAGNPEFEVSEDELNRGGVSFTIETVRAFSERYVGAELVYLIGADHVATLPQWKEAECLARLVEFAVIPRPGEKPVPSPSGFRCQYLKGFPIELSSSLVRERIAKQLPIDPFVPRNVAEVIRRYQLYSHL
jgi:nicotinate-nucleotide adenylyltransferase